jgi:NYN domain
MTVVDRYALFVDAGYVLATGSQVACGRATATRRDASCDYAALLASLQKTVADHCSLPILRTYWYDAAPNASPTADQLRIAALADVKVRLGRLIGNRQKGVDSLIVRDLMTLARERAIATAYLVGGDEDLREGVAAAQDMGVRVVVIGVPTTAPNQAMTLINEADGNLILPNDFWAPHFTATLAGAQVAMPVPTEVVVLDAALVVEAGRVFGLEFYRGAPPDLLVAMQEGRPLIPRDIDRELIVHTGRSCGGRMVTPDHRAAMRLGFWQGFDEAATPAPIDGADPGLTEG